jgi:flagellar biosynthetic protein FliQ
MNPLDAIDLGREAIITSLLIGAPVLLVGVVVGLVIGLFQAVTQVQDQTISFVPKIVAMVGALALCLPWLVQRMVEYSQELIENIPRIVSGG